MKQSGVLIGGILLPIEPFYRLTTVAELLDIHLSYLYRLLSIHRARFPARYRRDGKHPRNVRVLTASEVRRLYGLLGWKAKKPLRGARVSSSP